MKYLSVLFLLCFTSVVSAQDSTLVALETPKLSIGLVEGGSYMHEYVTVKFIKVIQDSRCPKNVMCIRAGEAEVLIGIYKNGLLLEEKSIIVRPNTRLLTLYSNAEVIVSAVNLFPYPKEVGTVSDRSYVLDLLFE
ncbi:hypothetical protein [Olleya namhaensis]|uniref:Uncharacterized protein n=1 Tax=Olleya namhaensis TaxID=1144750 RepID=A0A1I3JXZ9_9FLAO|nr:hypothetical protein [Olleya namhaensis]SFI65122.1 hypothetical protein SAMN05443431_101605 [Olleya namhaensis]